MTSRAHNCHVEFKRNLKKAQVIEDGDINNDNTKWKHHTNIYDQLCFDLSAFWLFCLLLFIIMQINMYICSVSHFHIMFECCVFILCLFRLFQVQTPACLHLLTFAACLLRTWTILWITAFQAQPLCRCCFRLSRLRNAALAEYCW